MSSSSVKSLLVRDVVELMPPLIRDSLLEDTNFCAAYELRSEVALSFHDASVSIARSTLFDAARHVLAGEAAADIADIAGRKWVLHYSSKEREPSRLVLSSDNQRLDLPDLSTLSADQTIRLCALREVAAEVNLPTSSYNEWYSILLKRPLDDDVHAFHRNTLETPVAQAQLIRAQLLNGHTNLPSLLPPSRRYFERLVGKYDGSPTIWDYATSCIGALFDQLTTWRAYDGFLFSLFLASHSSITEAIKVDQLDQVALISAFDFLVKHGDRISQVGAIEVGLRILSARPEIEPFLVSLIEQLRDDAVDEPQSGFNLLEALFILVDGELSRLHLFSAEPPFYRRLAALSQAALIHRQLIDSAVDIEHFAKWAFPIRAEQYYLQSLVDMRSEPYWNPQLAAPSQLKDEFLGRILIAAKTYEHNIKEGKLFDLLLSNKVESLHASTNLLLSQLPGPLEGTEKTQRTLPAEIAEVINTQLATEKVEFSSFITLVNCASLFQVDAKKASVAVQAIRRSTYQFTDITDKSQLLTLFYGLAKVAAVTRHPALADELRILSRRYKSNSRFSLRIDEILRFCLIAAASHADPKEWRAFVGDWLTELAFSELEDDDGQQLYLYLQYLLQIVPELWFTCGKADAALLAFIES